MKPTGYVYFVQGAAGGPIKIGWTQNLRQRLASLQSAHSDKLVLLGAIEGSQDVEYHMHKDLAEHRLRGEWFEDTDEVRARIPWDPARASLDELADRYEYAAGRLQMAALEARRGSREGMYVEITLALASFRSNGTTDDDFRAMAEQLSLEDRLARRAERKL